ncbi:Sensor histidine kinase graS [uncultured Roseburia sp.]|uniref:histidine kinase n=1 Tax=Brotonthovivens ammoniilytica TaxID=2981725 RepID=A0ABT2TJ14_9FIRM|nr:sensor histidine kinase [Brotonthovivens ammoniilytica]MCU6762205.1 sensor histidine kinase [Brotonthovivens ammoniilytica]SCI58743.1 Sensor histidine kinase graS [uncultured Roseburia sp.]
MKEEHKLKIFLSYLAQHKFTWSFFLLCVGLFLCVFSLYSLELEAVLYAAVLCLILGIILALLRFPGWYKLHRQLQIARNSIILMTNQLPQPGSLIEKDYQTLVHSLNRLYSQKITAEQMQKNNLIEYYTTWCHQIKTPIAAMSLLLQEEDTQKNRQLKSELFRIEQYVEMVLCYFRIDSPSSDFILKPCDLDTVIRMAVRKYAGQFVQKKLRLIYEPTHQSVLTDEKWLSFILEQLLSNAVKYTKEGSITIAVDQNQVLSVSDTGIGIAKEDLPRIFENSFTGYNGRTDRKSTGLGLYLCQQIARKLSHTLSVKSQIGCGTTFYLDLKTRPLKVE